MIYSRAMIPAVILSVSLLTTGCKNKEAAQESLSETIIQSATPVNVSEKTFESFLKVKKRSVKSASANVALAKMGLDDTANGPFSWDKKSGDKGHYTYTNLSAKTDDGETVNIATLKLTGVRMEDENPTFDRMDIDGLKLTSVDQNMSFAKASLSRPSPTLGMSIMAIVEKIQDAGDLSDLGMHIEDMNIENEDIGFGALLIDKFVIKSNDANIDIDSLGWGEDPKSKEAIFLIEDLAISAAPKAGELPINISLETFSGTGIDMDHIRTLRAEGENMISGSQKLNPFDPLFDGIFLENFNISLDSLNINAPNISTSSKKKGDVVTTQQSLQPMTISFSGEPEEHELKQFWNLLQSSGYESLVFSGQSTTIMDESEDSFAVKDGLFSLKDGFDINFGYEGNGIKAMSHRKSGIETSDDLLADLKLRNMNISITDRSIIDRVVAFAAKEQGMPEQLIRMSAKGGIMFAGGALAQQAETEEQQAVITDMVNAVSTFLDNGGTIHLKLNPPAPLQVADFQNMEPAKLNPQELGLEITHEK